MSKVASLDLGKKVSAALDTPTDLSAEAVKNISAALNKILADAYALYIKTKNFHWHVSGPHFRDYHKLFDEQAADILESTDPDAELFAFQEPSTLGRMRAFVSRMTQAVAR